MPLTVGGGTECSLSGEGLLVTLDFALHEQTGDGFEYYADELVFSGEEAGPSQPFEVLQDDVVTVLVVPGEKALLTRVIRMPQLPHRINHVTVHFRRLPLYLFEA